MTRELHRQANGNATTTPSCLDAALSYARDNDWFVFPGWEEEARTKDGRTVWQKKSHKSAEHSGGMRWGATKDLGQIGRDFRKWQDAWVCVPTEENGIFVVDADTPEGHPPKPGEPIVDGVANLKRLEETNEPLPSTRMARSPSGSIHYVFKLPKGVRIVNSASKICPGVDIRGEGGMFVAPPSIRNGIAYEWLNDAEIADPPAWLIEHIRLCDKQSPQAKVKGSSPPPWLTLLKGNHGKGLSDDPDDVLRPLDRATAEAALSVLTDEAILRIKFGRTEWIAVGGVLFKNFGNDIGFAIWNWWSSGSRNYQADNIAGQWRSIVAKGGYGWDAGTLLYWANLADPDWRDKIEYPEPPPEERQSEDDDDGQTDEPQSEDPPPKPVAGGQTGDRKKSTSDDPVDLWSKFDTPELPAGLLPEVIERFARIEGENMGCDPAGLAMAALTICAAAIPDRIRLQVKEHDPNWTEPARLWTALVGDPSAKKSPILYQAGIPLAKIDRGLTCQYLAEKQQYDELSADQKKSAKPPRQPRVKIEDVTIEAAQEVLKDSPDGVLCLQDELSGLFGNMDKYSGKGSGADRAFWMKAYNGGPATYHRIARGSGFIPNLSISLLGGIQPEPIRKVAADGIDDGLLQRMLFIVLRPAKVDQDKPRDPVVRDYHKLVDKLFRLRPPQDGFDGDRDDVVLRFDKGAQDIRSRLAEKHIKMMGYETINKKLATHVGKYDGVFARLCVLWHCVENADRDRLPTVVTEATARRVATFLHEFVFEHAVAFYNNVLGLADEHERLANVAGYILARKLYKITNRDIQRGDRSMRRLTDLDTQKIFAQLEALGWLERVQTRTVVRWMVNPAVHTKFADRARREKERRDEAREAVADLFKKEKRA